METKSEKKIDGGAESGSSPSSCSAWIPASAPPKYWTRVIAKNEHDEIEQANWLNDLDNGKPDGFYVPIGGGNLKLWKHATHYILWPNAIGEARAESATPPHDQTI